MTISLAQNSTDFSTSARRSRYKLTPFDLAVLLYLAGMGLGLGPVFSGGNWREALLRLGLVALSIGIYFVITRLFTATRYTLGLALVCPGLTALVALLGTAQVNTDFLRLTGLNYQVYTSLRRVIPTEGLPQVHQNVLAGFLVVLVPLSLALTIWSKRRLLRVYSAACSILILVSLLVTSSRGAWLSLFAVVGVLGWFWLQPYRAALLTLGALWLAGLLAGLVYLLGGGLARLDSGLNRLELWRTSLSMIGDYPLSGAGLGQFQHRFDSYASPYIYGQLQPHTHNLFLQSLAEFGVFGIGAILITLFTTLLLLFRYRNLTAIELALKPVVVGALAGLVALFVHGLVDYGTWGGWFAPAFWFLPALLNRCNLNLSFKRWPKLSRHPLAFAAGALLILAGALPLLLLNFASLAPKKELYEAASLLAPWNGAAQRGLAVLATRAGDVTQAEIHYKQAVERNAGDWLSWLALAEQASQQNRPDQALLYWRKAEATPYFYQLGQQALQGQPPDHQAAEKFFALTLELDPTHREAGRSLVAIYHHLGRKDEAKRLLARLSEQQPDPALLVQAATLADSPQESVRLILQAIAGDPGNASYYWELGNAYRATGQLAQAEQSYQQARLLSPVDQRPARSLAELYIMQQKPAAAVAELEKSLGSKVFIESPFSEYLLLARAYLALNDYGKALAASEKAIYHNPASVTAHLLRGDSFRGQNNQTQAREAYGRALQLAPANPEVQQRLAALTEPK